MRHAKKQESMTHALKKKQATETACMNDVSQGSPENNQQVVYT